MSVVRQQAGFGHSSILRTTGLLIVAALLGARSVQAQQPYDPADAPPVTTDSGGYQDGGYQQTAATADPSSRIARLSVLDGSVSIEPASVNDFSPAELNYPLTTGDRVWVDNGSVAEIEAGQLAVRLGETTDLTVSAVTDTLAQFGLAQGGVHLRTWALDPGTTTELDTPNVAVTVLSPGDVRVDVDPNNDTTTVTVLSGEVEIDGNGLQQTIAAGQRMRLQGTDPVVAQWQQPGGTDGLDSFSAQRDNLNAEAQRAEQSYLNPDTVGGADLATYGTWTNDDDYGAVWYPSGVAVGWQPYCYGHWTWIAPWGWTWVEREPWGFAPFHYGRWAQIGGRWGWVPGPPVVHPVYSPGLVVFVNAGSGVTAWFPLGPREAYAPWYHASVLYRNRVNVSNLPSRNPSQIRAIYRTGDRELYANPLGPQQRFANRETATVAMSQASFAAGRAASAARVPLRTEQVAGAAVLPHPLVTPERTMVAPISAQALPPRAARPTLASRRDTALRAGAAGRVPAPAGAGTGSPAGPPAPVERRGGTVWAERGVRPAASQGQPAGGTEARQPRAPGYGQTRQAVEGRVPAGEAGQTRQPQTERANPAMTIEGGVREPSPARGTERLPNPGTMAQPAGVPAERPFYNRAVPPPERPGFEQQRDAIQRSDPGRPLSPQQMENLRESRPAGPPQMREPAPHAPAEPHGAPPAASHTPPPAGGSAAPQGRPDGRR